MEPKIVWEYGSHQPENGNNLDTIRQWWQKLQGQEVTWRQRLLTGDKSPEDLDWDPQRFDETFSIQKTDLRGITLYWTQPQDDRERNTTARKLELDRLRQQLFIYPQSQHQLVIRVAVPQIEYQTIELDNPEIAGATSEGHAIVIFRDETQQLEIKAKLSPERVKQLKQEL
jgi:hypothetical protein